MKSIAKGAFMTTIEFAAQVCRSDQTIRKLHSQTGEAFGVRPIKVGRLLLWPVADVQRVLTDFEGCPK
jgi:hypothetical protein